MTDEPNLSINILIILIEYNDSFGALKIHETLNIFDTYHFTTNYDFGL